jgi:predicted nucleic acid-binding protein
VNERAVLDTGALVATVRTREKAHKACVATLKALRAPLLRCWPVLTEAAWLLRNEKGGMKILGDLVRSGGVRVV